MLPQTDNAKRKVTVTKFKMTKLSENWGIIKKLLRKEGARLKRNLKNIMKTRGSRGIGLEERKW